MSGKTCLIVGAGDFDGLLLPPAPEDLVIAADGGYRALRALGIEPTLVLGDFDSLGEAPVRPGVIRAPAEKDDTDMLLALKAALSRDCDRILIYGGLGGERIEHSLANLQTLLFAAERGARAYLIGRGAVLTVLRNGDLAFPAACRGYFSVFAMGGQARGVTLEGLKYTLRDAALTPGMPLGVSNEFVGEDARVSVEDGALLLCWSACNPVFF